MLFSSAGGGAYALPSGCQVVLSESSESPNSVGDIHDLSIRKTTGAMTSFRDNLGGFISPAEAHHMDFLARCQAVFMVLCDTRSSGLPRADRAASPGDAQIWRSYGALGLGQVILARFWVRNRLLAVIERSWSLEVPTGRVPIMGQRSRQQGERLYHAPRWRYR